MFRFNRWRSVVIVLMLTFLSTQIAICKGGWKQLVIDHKVEVDRLLSSGNQYFAKGQYREAIKSYLQSLAISKQSGDREGEGIILNSLGNIYNVLGQYQTAIDYYKKSLRIRKEIGHRQVKRYLLLALVMYIVI